MNTQRVEGHTPKDCPFCGATPELFSPNEDYSDAFDIRCGTEGCFLQHGADYRLDKDSLITRWNLRNSNIDRLEKVNEALVRALEIMVDGFDAEDKATIPQVRSAVEALRLAKEPT